jgi:hypothetical protein
MISYDYVIYSFLSVWLLLLIYKYEKSAFYKSKKIDEKFLRIIEKQDKRMHKMRLERISEVLEAEFGSSSAGQKRYKEIAHQLYIAIFG